MRRKTRPAADIGFLHFRIFTFGSDAEMIVAFGSLERAREEWERVSSRFMEQWKLWGMPQAWWRFEPGIPSELRAGPAMILSEADGDAWRDLEQARRAYLTSLGIDWASRSRT